MTSMMGRFVFLGGTVSPVLRVCPVPGPAWEAKWIWQSRRANWCLWKAETVQVVNPNTTEIIAVDWLDLIVETL